MVSSSKNRKIAIALALVGAFKPTPFPLSGLHKLYLGQPVWGVVYLLLAWTQIPRIACAIEGMWYLTQSDNAFAAHFDTTQLNAPMEVSTPPVVGTKATGDQIGAIATALRDLDALRQDGLISEYEFEQKRRRLLDHIA